MQPILYPTTLGGLIFACYKEIESRPEICILKIFMISIYFTVKISSGYCEKDRTLVCGVVYLGLAEQMVLGYRSEDFQMNVQVSFLVQSQYDP